ncbi:helix-turn-helix domain-containing protein [Amycolatopsis plumensis]|uniref:Helix-turn-helix domain-containing protein n=1 Tax=Amycolatopsis plumensis TaxID=236508 RepID=A0ABV5U8E6_9PSEU
MARVPNPIPKGAEIEAIRVSQGMSRRTFAEKAEVAWKTVYNVENGYNPRVSREVLQRMANALGVDVERIREPDPVAA